MRVSSNRAAYASFLIRFILVIDLLNRIGWSEISSSGLHLSSSIAVARLLNPFAYARSRSRAAPQSCMGSPRCVREKRLVNALTFSHIPLFQYSFAPVKPLALIPKSRSEWRRSRRGAPTKFLA